MEYILMLLAIGFLGGGLAAFSSEPSAITDQQYREIRSNMKGRTV